ncbi:MAG: thioredoxin domain-containing protein, partial [Calditrichaceae bacterium]
MYRIKSPYLVILCLLLITGALTAGDLPNWKSGATGYYTAQKTALTSEKPFIVYFKTDWCGYCKKMDANYLSTFQFSNFLYNIPKVVINPEKGQQEKALARQYGVTGYPSFFILVPSLSNG